MTLLDIFGGAYPLYTLACSVIFPIIAAVAVFVCLRRAGAARRILGYFISMPIYVSLCVFLLCDPGTGILSLLEKHSVTVHQPQAIGFLASVALGVLYLGTVSAICGGRTQKKGGRVVSAILTAIFFAAEGYLTVMAHILRPEAVKTLALPNCTELLKHYGISFAIPMGMDILALAAAALYILAYFLCFIGSAPKKEFSARLSERRTDNYDPMIEPCCALCEHAQLLKDDHEHVLCDSCGITPERHSCRGFVYDPLKRRPARLPREPRLDDLTTPDSK